MNLTVYIGNLKEYRNTLLELIKEFRNIAAFKAGLQNSLPFYILATNFKK